MLKIDRFELYVPDREAAATWYTKWLGFERIPEHADWAATGMLMLTCDGGRTMLQLTTGEPTGIREPKGWRRLALRADIGDFISFLQRFRDSGQEVDGPINLRKAWALYFTDPWGNQLELTTYDYHAVAQILGS